jgi:2-polyprenyl-3-methyl-5-hydroxy-6-metoxy-1,4-benzoquinol methylase
MYRPDDATKEGQLYGDQDRMTQRSTAHVESAAGYVHIDAAPAQTHTYLWPTVIKELPAIVAGRAAPRVMDLGCGNGAFAADLLARGYDVTGVDPSDDGIRIARHAHPNLKTFQGSAYDDLARQYGRFDAVVSLEVVEHVYAPRQYAACVYDLLEPGGVALISTPYHGYAKNLALALTGKLESHFTVLWDHGHIKFWSRRTLAQLLTEAGFRAVSFHRVGRIPAFAKSMIAVARK